MGALAASALDGVKPLAKVLEVTADHRGHGLALGLVDDPVDQAVDVLRVAHLAAVDGRTRGTKHVERSLDRRPEAQFLVAGCDVVVQRTDDPVEQALIQAYKAPNRVAFYDVTRRRRGRNLSESDLDVGLQLANRRVIRAGGAVIAQHDPVRPLCSRPGVPVKRLRRVAAGFVSQPYQSVLVVEKPSEPARLAYEGNRRQLTQFDVAQQLFCQRQGCLPA